MEVYVADKHDLIIEGIKTLLARHGIKVGGSFKNGLEVIKWRETNEADVLILDTSMPILNGIDVLKHFRKERIVQKTLVFSTYNDYHFITEVMKNGGCGYILKTDVEVLVDAIKKVYKGERYLSKSVTKTILNRHLRSEDDTEKTETKTLLEDLIHCKVRKLSEKERRILELLARKYSS